MTDKQIQEAVDAGTVCVLCNKKLQDKDVNDCFVQGKTIMHRECIEQISD